MAAEAPSIPAPAAGDLVRVRGLSKRYRRRRRFRQAEPAVQAVDRVDLDLSAGSTLALVGQSGAGKSTLGRCLARLEEPDHGEVWFEGQNILTLRGRHLFAVRGKIQMILQDAATALNPRMPAAEIVAEPMRIRGRFGRPERHRRALELMEQVGLLPQWGGRLPFELSGGQRQRLAIARALAVDPRLLILDEALSGLDPSIQAQIVNLLAELQATRQLTYLYISHDLGLMTRAADELVVMYQGRIVERASISTMLSSPRHPHTRELIAAAPVLRPPARTPTGGRP